MADPFDTLRQEIEAHDTNRAFTAQGVAPMFMANARARIMLVGQAPGLQALEKGRVFDDASGVRLKEWLGVDDAAFRNPELFAVIPMDFYYPGKGKHGDNPPRKGFADLWHPRFLALMPAVRLTILVGQYAQRHYLKSKRKKNLTETVRAYQEYLPDYFPIVHPSPLNFRWFAKNPWFEEDVVPDLQQLVKIVIK